MIDDNFLADCDTEFIHFSERMDWTEQTEGLVSLETYQPTRSHQDYAAMIKQLQCDGPEIVMNRTGLLQSHYTIMPDTAHQDSSSRSVGRHQSRKDKELMEISIPGSYD